MVLLGASIRHSHVGVEGKNKLDNVLGNAIDRYNVRLNRYKLFVVEHEIEGTWGVFTNPLEEEEEEEEELKNTHSVTVPLLAAGKRVCAVVVVAVLAVLV